MSLEATAEAAVSRLRAAGLPEPTARALAERMAGALEQLRAQADALPPATEPATTFAAGSPRDRTGTE